MRQLSAVGTYLPPWGTGEARLLGADEDAVTMAVAAGRAALRGVVTSVRRVVCVSRDLPLLEGGNGAALLAGLGLRSDLMVVEQIGARPPRRSAGARPGD